MRIIVYINKMLNTLCSGWLVKNHRAHLCCYRFILMEDFIALSLYSFLYKFSFLGVLAFKI